MQYTHQEFTLRTADSLELFGTTDAPEKPVAVVVIIHGLCEHLGRFDEISSRMNNAGYATLRFDQRGHGRSEGDLPQYDSFQQILSDTDLFVQKARELFPELPLFLMGHSLGGFAAAAWGAAYPHTADGFILCAAWTHDEGITHVDSAQSSDEIVRYTISPEKRHFSPSGKNKTYDPLLRSQFRIGLMRALNSGIGWLGDHFSDFSDPVFFAYGGSDDLLPKTSLNTYGEVSSTDKSLFVYAALHHMLLHEEKGVRVVRDILEWLEDHTTNRP